VEQKNGSIVRQIVGYDRFEGELAYHQLAEVYRALRLYVNFFQPSLKLVLKRREGSRVYRRYDTAQTPLQRLLATDALADAGRARLVALYEALDPVQVLRQLQRLQEALWQHAVTLPPASPAPTVRFALSGAASVGAAEDLELEPSAALHPRARRRPTGLDRHRARTARTSPARLDPFVGEWDTIDAWLAAQPEQPGSALHPEGAHPASRSSNERQRARTPDEFSSSTRTSAPNAPNVRSIICVACGASDTVLRGERGPLTAYCDVCRAQRKRDQARQRMVLLRARQRGGDGMRAGE
jgi:hypothetical protein